MNLQAVYHIRVCNWQESISGSVPLQTYLQNKALTIWHTLITEPVYQRDSKLDEYSEKSFEGLKHVI